MSGHRIIERWEDAGSGPGAMVRVSVADSTLRRLRRRFVAHIDAHGTECGPQCAERRDLWWAYKDGRT